MSNNYLSFKPIFTKLINNRFALLHYREINVEKHQQSMVEHHYRYKILSLCLDHKKFLRVRGVGYMFELHENNILKIDVGCSYKLRIKIPREITISLSRKQTRIKLKMGDLQKLGQFIAQVRDLRKPDVYKGKGIRYIRDPIKLKIRDEKKI